MKTSARFLAMLIAVLMIASAAITASAGFPDVEEGYKHATAIATLNQLEVIGGYEDGTFKPNDPVQRDEMAKLVYVLSTTFQDAGSGNVKFSDVPAGNWATGYVSWCSAKAIVGGYGDGTFKPDNNVTYDEALKMVCATLGYTDFDSKLWPTDVRQKAIIELKLNTGLEDVKGGDYLTRGQVAQLLYNALDTKMAEVKIVYKETTIDGETYKVPVEVAQTLAKDVWKYEEKIVRVIGTQNFLYNGNTTKGSASAIVAASSWAYVDVDHDDDPATETVAVLTYSDVKTYALADLGLEAYKDNTDALIGLDIMTVAKDGKLLAKANVLGSTKVASVTTGTNGITIDGVLYATAGQTLFANLKTLTYGDAGAVNTEAALSTDAKTDVKWPHTAIVMDNEGDGIVDAVAISYYEPYVVTDAKAVAATSSVAAHTLYTVNANLKATTGGTPVKSLNIADGKTLAKGDIFVAAKIADTWYVDAVVEATKDAVATKMNGTDVTLDGVGTVSIAQAFNGVGAVDFNINMLNWVDGKPQTANYYIYNNTVIYTTASEEEAAESYNIALLLYVDKAGEGKWVNNKLVTTYTAVLLIDGKQTTVNLDSAEAIVTEDGTLTGAQASAEGAQDGTGRSPFRIGFEGDGVTAKYPYTLVTYTVDADGEYTLCTDSFETLGKTVVAAEKSALKFNPKTDLITIGDYKVVLNDASVIYYTYKKTGDNYNYLGTYTSANIVEDFKDDQIEQEAFLLKNEDGTYTLLATLIDGELVKDGVTVTPTSTYKNDARLIKYSVAASGADTVDGLAYRTYAFLDMATMTNGALTIDTRNSVAGGAIPAASGKFYGWDDTNKVYVEVNNDAVDADTIQIGTIDAVYAGIVDIGSTDWADGVKLGADVKIFGAASNSATAYKTFDVAALAELLAAVKAENIRLGNIDADTGATIDGKTPIVINCAVGTYLDGSETKIAWIIVDNYYTAANGTFTKAADIVGAID